MTDRCPTCGRASLKDKRTLEQNSKMWPMLHDIAKQVKWAGQYLSPDDWKDLFTAVMRKQKIVPGLEGGLVSIGGHTSKMTVSEMSEMIEYMYAFGADRDVVWSEPTVEPVK